MEKQFIYDTHIHTIETSPCGKIPAVDTVDYYAEHGYAGIVITDHLHQEFLHKFNENADWDHIIDLYLAGYHSAKKRGDEIGFDVILGSEMRFTDNDNDYLVYNIDETWLRTHPFVICQTANEFFSKYHDEVLILQAHPYRDGNMTVFEDAVHGIELINTNQRHNNWLDRALMLYQKHPEYFISAGSDMHQVQDRCRAGIISDHRIKDSFEYAALIRSRSYDLYAPEFPEFVEAYQNISKNYKKDR